MPTHDPRTSRRRADRDPILHDLADRLPGHIERRTGGRVRDVHVTCSWGVLILQGRSRTYHAKQLAQEAALDLAGGRYDLANQIVVG